MNRTHKDMDLEVALNLLQCFLEKRGHVDCIKHLPGFVTLGRTKGCFGNSDLLFDVTEWRKLGDVLWDMVIDDDKTAKKLMKPWRDVINDLKRYQKEKSLAAVASDRGGSSSAWQQSICGTSATPSGWSERTQLQPVPASTLQPVTRGSLGLDLATAVNVTLLDQQPQKIPSTMTGPLTINNKPQGALLIGRSSSGVRGLFVLLGLIDADFQGLISIVIQTLFPPIYIPAGSKIAQLIPLPQLTADMQTVSQKDRGTDGFGSTGGLALLTMPMNQRPVVKNQVQKLQVSDSWGLDEWLKSWGLGLWLQNIVMYGIGILVVILLVLLLLPCVVTCIQKMITRVMDQMGLTLLVQKEEGGIVEEFLE